MSRRSTRAALAGAASALLATAPITAVMVALPAAPAAAGQPAGYGPSDPFEDALMGQHGPAEPMKNQAKIERTKYGYRFIAGQQHSHLTMTVTSNGSLRYRDTGTQRWKSLARACKPQRVKVGVSAVCKRPASTSPSNPTLLEVRPRLGNDYIDARTLPAVFEMAVLADAGRDTVFTGRGNDFINGAQDPDRIYGGAGKDWIRGGKGNDRIWGGADSDYIVGQMGRDYINGGAGKDRIYQ